MNTNSLRKYTSIKKILIFKFKKFFNINLHSWKWAIENMKNGKTVINGKEEIKYKMDKKNHIIGSFKDDDETTGWTKFSLFLPDDTMSFEWRIYKEPIPNKNQKKSMDAVHKK